jgi:predicted transcriptional regulator of viral defense system
MEPSLRQSPDFDRLYETAESQHGLFTLEQAKAAGYSPQLLQHHLKTGRLLRPGRGIYRLKHYPYADDEGFMQLWLWSRHEGVLSHDTALSLYDLSDIFPHKTHITLPKSWRARRVAIPPGVVVHYAEVPESDRGWYGGVPITKVARTLNDCANNSLSPDLLSQGAREALARGLVRRAMLGPVEEALQPFGGLDR